MKKIKALAIFNALSFITHIVVAYFIQHKMMNQNDVEEIFGKYDSLFSPPMISFGIWGIIYTALGIFCLYHIVIAYKHDKDHPSNTDLQKIGLFFIISNLANAAWLVTFTQERLLISLALIFLQVLCLGMIHIKLRMYDRLRPAGAKTCTQFPLSIFLAWTTVAVIANAASYLVGIGWDGWGLTPSQWTLIMISFVVAISMIMIFARHDIYFGLVVAWGLYGIITKVNNANSDSFDSVMNTAWMGFGLIVLSCLIQILSNNRYKKPRAIFPSAAAPLK